MVRSFYSTNIFWKKLIKLIDINFQNGHLENKSHFRLLVYEILLTKIFSKLLANLPEIISLLQNALALNRDIDDNILIAPNFKLIFQKNS